MALVGIGSPQHIAGRAVQVHGRRGPDAYPL